MTNLPLDPAKVGVDREAYFSLAMQAALLGDEAVYRDLLSALRLIALGYSRRFLTRMGKFDPGTQEDLVQDILLACHTKRHTYDLSQPFLPWFIAIARYKLIDYGRQQKRRPAPVHLDELAEILAAPDVEAAGVGLDLAVLMQRLPDKARRALTLVKLEGYSVADAAAATAMSESAVKVSIHRTLKSLRERLRKLERGES